MNICKLTSFITIASMAYLSADICTTDGFHSQVGQRDFEAVQEFVNSKRTITLEEKACHFAIAGDVRYMYANISEKVDGCQLHGFDGCGRQFADTGVIFFDGNPPPKAGVPFSYNNYEVELNLYLDYVCGRSWAVAWIQFADDAGISQSKKTCLTDPEGLYGSGCSSSLALRKAYVGYNVYLDGCSRFDVELGRRPLYTLFDSRVQFQSSADGIYLKYARNMNNLGDFYWYTTMFMVDERSDQYAWITELGLLGCHGFDLRYSFTDWESFLFDHNRNRCFTRDPIGADFRISQFTLSYAFCPDFACMPCMLRKPTKLYGAVLYNHDASKIRSNPTPGPRFTKEIVDGEEVDVETNPLGFFTVNGKKGLAWYAGVIFGEVCHEGDWAIDVTYQYVEPYSIPDPDCSGIGRNGRNLLNETLTSFGRGFSNYQGIRVEGLVSITDNLSLDATVEASHSIDKNLKGVASSEVSGPIPYKKIEVEAIYAF